jgi:hypothetical protein
MHEYRRSHRHEKIDSFVAEVAKNSWIKSQSVPGKSSSLMMRRSVPSPKSKKKSKAQGEKIAFRPLQAGEPVVVFDIDDTLIRDREDSFRVNPSVVVLLQKLREKLGAHVHLVTARNDDDETVAWTKNQLSIVGLDEYDSLWHAPNKYRKSMSIVSRWKMNVRAQIALHYGVPVTLTVGDQWGDITVLASDDDILKMDVCFESLKNPWILLSPNDGISLYGLKLIARYD